MRAVFAEFKIFDGRFRCRIISCSWCGGVDGHLTEGQLLGLA